MINAPEGGPGNDWIGHATVNVLISPAPARAVRKRTIAWAVCLLSIAGLLAAMTVFAPRARADNPIVQTIYTADPAPLVYDGKVYLYADHDEDNSNNYIMKDWRVYSSTDMVN